MKKKIISVFAAAAMLASVMTAPVTAETTNVNIAPKNFTTSNRGSYYSVSWTNPERDDISKIELYDVQSGKTLLASSESTSTMVTTPGSASYYAFKSDKEQWATYVFRVEFTFANGETFSSEINGHYKDSDVDGWYSDYTLNNGAVLDAILANDKSLGFNFWSRNYPMQNISVTTKDANSGNASLSITGNMPAGTVGYNAPDYNFGIMQPKNMNLQDGTTYKLSYYVKAADNGISGELHVQHGVTWDTKTPEQLVTTSEVPDWTLKEFTFTKASNGNLYFMYTCANFLLDDIELYALDSDGNETGDNLITNGGFEDGVESNAAPTDVINAAFNPDTYMITWGNPENKDYSDITVYEKYGDYLNPVKSGVSNGYTVTGLSAGQEKTFVIKTVNKYGKESEGVTVTAYAEKANIAPLNFTSATRGSYYTVSWTNPARADIAKIELFDLKDGSKTLLASSDNTSTMVTTPGSASYYAFKSDKAQWASYLFRVEFTYTNGEKFASEIDGHYTDSDVDGWYSDYTPNNGAVLEVDRGLGFNFWSRNYPMQNIAVTTKDAHSGNAALSITGNMPAGTQGNNGPTWNFGIMQPKSMSLVNGTTYKCSYYIKAADNGISGEFHAQHGVTWDTKSEDQVVTTAEVPDWTLKEYTFTKASNGNFYFMYTCANFLLDDIELYALDSDGNKTGENLVANGGFEDGVTLTEFPQMTDVSGSVADGSVVLNWTLGEDGSASKVNVYEVYDGHENRVKTADASAGYCTFVPAEEKQNYSYILKMENSYGVESEGVEVSAERHKSVAVTAYEVSGDSEEETSVIVPGTMRARAAISYAAAGDTAVVLIAQYDIDNVLIGVSVGQLATSDGTTFTAEADIEADTMAETMKIFVFENTNNIKPLRECVELGVE